VGGVQPTTHGFYIDTTPGGVIERCRFTLKPGYSQAAGFANASQFELYESWLYTNTAQSVGNGLELNPGCAVTAIGNTIDSVGSAIAGGNSGFYCLNGSTAVLTNNIINGGRGATNHWMAYGNTGTTCFSSAMSAFKNNYFYYTATGAQTAGDTTPSIVANPNSSGNVIDNQQVGCFDGAAPQPTYKLAAGSKCANMGIAAMHKDGSSITVDIDNMTRVLGAAVDIGCSEKE
jgi:hypothetical protein